MKYKIPFKKWGLLTVACLGLLVVQAQNQSKALKILLISDLNDGYGSTTYSEEVHDVIRQVQEIKPDMVLCAGDMVAGQKASLTAEQLDAMWAGFDQTVLTPLAAQQVPFGFTMGNHDASPNYQLDRAASHKFWLANKAKVQLDFVDDSHYPYYFSYIKHGVFFISWDASSAVIPAEIKDWMKEQLTLPLAKKARGRVVLGHLPLYALVAAKNKPGEVLAEADETLAFFASHAVDMYISGHQHAYFPAAKKNITLLHAGCLGGGPRSLLGHDAPPYKSYALIEIPKGKRVAKAQITGFVARDQRRLQLRELPESVQGFNGTVERIDLAK